MTDRNYTCVASAMQSSKKNRIAKLTKDIFAERAVLVHGNKFDYSKSIVVSAREKILIHCNTCDFDFNQKPYSHLGGSGCPNCARIDNAIKKRFTKDDFVEKSKEKHGNKYNYSNVIYTRNDEKVEIICNTCNTHFWQKPNNHFLGQGCPTCYGANKKDIESFVLEYREKFPERNYDFSKSKYTNANASMVVTCSKHGDFKSRPSGLLRGKGCPDCGREQIVLKNIISFDEFISRAKAKHGDLFLYKPETYSGINAKLSIFCKEHGWYEQRGIDHINGHGCRKCGRNANGFARSNFVNISKSRDNTAMLYVLKIFSDNELFFKIGITTRTVRERFWSGMANYQYEILHEVFGDAGYIYDLETQIHRLLRDFHYTPGFKFGGSVYECFSKIPKEVEKLLKTLENSKQMQLIA